jgi:hypothetical protein
MESGKAQNVPRGIWWQPKGHIDSLLSFASARQQESCPSEISNSGSGSQVWKRFTTKKALSFPQSTVVWYHVTGPETLRKFHGRRVKTSPYLFYTWALLWTALPVASRHLVWGAPCNTSDLGLSRTSSAGDKTQVLTWSAKLKTRNTTANIYSKAAGSICAWRFVLPWPLLSGQQWVQRKL